MCPMSLHLLLSRDAKQQRIMKAINVGVDVGVDEAGQQRPALGVDTGCSPWHRITDGLYRCATDNDVPTVKNALTIENTRIADGCNHGFILAHTSMDVVERVFIA